MLDKHASSLRGSPAYGDMPDFFLCDPPVRATNLLSLIAFSTHKKILQPLKPLEKKVDRMIYCKAYPKASGC